MLPFEQEMQTEDLTNLHVAIVGAGVVGVHSALILTRRGARVTLLEKRDTPGGVWNYFANEGSRVQVAEPCYRLIPEKLLSNFSEVGEVVTTLEEAVAEIRAGRGEAHFGVTMEHVRNTGESVSIECSSGADRKIFVADHVLLCVGGLQSPVRRSFPNENEFRGQLAYGIAGEADHIDVKGKQVLILGMGAFAIENARECLFHGAEHVTMLARNRNQIVAQLWMYLPFAQPQTYAPARLQQAALSDQAEAKGEPQQWSAVKPTEIFAEMQKMMIQSYRRCDAEDAMPDEFRKFLKSGNMRDLRRRESPGTIPTASDPFFVALALGKLSVVRGEVEKMLPDGVETLTGQQIKASIVIKNFGFDDPDAWLKPIVGQKHMHSPMVINDRVWLVKCERAKLTRERVRKVGAEAFGDMLNIPAVAPAVAATFVELFCYFQARPEKLAGLIDSGKLPHVEIGEDTPLSMSQGMWAMMQSDPALHERANHCREQVSVDMKKRWTHIQYFQENRIWWRYCCKRMSGDEESVPYLWDHLETFFEMLDQMEAQKLQIDRSLLTSRSRL